MPDPFSSILAEFNRQVLLFQDEVFTLACDLSGDETTAAEITQGAFLHVYCHEWKGDGSIHLAVLRCVIKDCSRSPAKLENKKDILPVDLPEPERLVLLLVGHLDLTNEETSRVLHCSSGKVARQLAQARCKIADYNRIRLRDIHG